MSLGLGKSELYLLGLGALLHDIGLTQVYKLILNKQGSLSPGEFAEIKKHPLHAEKILAGLDKQVVRIALQHHERLDGSGYPRGLRGREVDFLAQIVAVADIYEAMINERAYRQAHPAREALEYLMASGGTLFDLSIIKAFVQNVTAYPAGTLVRLSSGETGVVCQNRRGLPLHPLVEIFFDPAGQPVTPYRVDTYQRRLALREIDNQDVLFKLSVLAGRK